ncbi:MAG: hypothetical protein RR335_11915 [Eubacterium sp.]
MNDEAQRYADYVKNYILGLKKEIKVAVVPVLTEDENISIKIHVVDLQYKKSVIFKAFIPEEHNWQMSLMTIKCRVNKELGYTVFY